jgi:hypothetical protein
MTFDQRGADLEGYCGRRAGKVGAEALACPRPVWPVSGTLGPARAAGWNIAEVFEDKSIPDYASFSACRDVVQIRNI